MREQQESPKYAEARQRIEAALNKPMAAEEALHILLQNDFLETKGFILKACRNPKLRDQIREYGLCSAACRDRRCHTVTKPAGSGLLMISDELPLDYQRIPDLHLAQVIYDSNGKLLSAVMLRPFH